MSHTKSEWIIGISYVEGWPVFRLRDLINPNDRTEIQADANLMEAAPNLLEACEVIKECLLTHGEWDDRCFYYAKTSASELEEPLKLLKAAIAKAKKE